MSLIPAGSGAYPDRHSGKRSLVFARADRGKQLLVGAKTTREGLVRSTSAFAAGAGAAYFFDPRLGRQRRIFVRDRALGLLRRTKRVGAGKVKLAGGQARGFLALLRRLRRRSSVAMDDQTVTHRIRSDAFRDVGVSTRDVDVEVEDGLARLRGSIDSISLAEELVTRVRRVPGVRDVSAELKVAEP